MSGSYYPQTNDGRAHWWQNVLTNGPEAFNALNWSSPQSAPILADAGWGVYCYGTLRTAFDVFNKAVTSYADAVLDLQTGAVPAAPSVPAFPATPTNVGFAGPGIEKRRELWVQEIKNNTAYTRPIGVLLGIETPEIPFNKGTYQAQLYALTALNPHSVTGKFRKANGQLDSINFYGRKHNAGGEWALLGKFSAVPFSASVPVAGANPEEWEFQAIAVRRDVEFGVPSDTIVQVVRP